MRALITSPLDYREKGDISCHVGNLAMGLVSGGWDIRVPVRRNEEECCDSLTVKTVRSARLPEWPFETPW